MHNMDPADVKSLQEDFIVRDIEQTDSQPVEKRLKAETLYYETLGILFVLRRKDDSQFDILAEVPLFLGEARSKWSVFCTPRPYHG